MTHTETHTLVRCKFRCESVKKLVRSIRDDGGRVTGERFVYEAEFSAVHGGSPENDRYFEATPFGSLKIGTLLADSFVPGREYYLDIVEA